MVAMSAEYQREYRKVKRAQFANTTAPFIEDDRKCKNPICARPHNGAVSRIVGKHTRWFYCSPECNRMHMP